MSAKRPPSPDLIANPFIKKRNLDWTLDLAEESGPGREEQHSPSEDRDQAGRAPESDAAIASTASIEAGRAPQTTDHLALFTANLTEHSIPSIPSLPIPSYADLYRSNADSRRGAHFVVHQHDHPIAGTHYDLRLQINESSSVSWAIMYGLPGDPNSTRLNRNATETRIHCLWNHLIETASSATGSLLIWDTGTYSILPRRSKHDPTPDPSSPPSSPPGSPSAYTQQALLHEAFQQRKIRLRLHGHRLPDPYIINLRLTKHEDAEGRQRASDPSRRSRRRRRRGVTPKQPEETSSDSEGSPEDPTAAGAAAENLSPMEREIREVEDEEVRRTNAYPGSRNTIGSVYARKWYVSLDRAACGFSQGPGKVWRQSTQENRPDHGSPYRLRYPFYVRGPDVERSVVTGRRGDDILRHERVTDFVPRRGWNPVVS